jgi:RNA polymerase sigma factor (sigma-70 family)
MAPGARWPHSLWRRARLGVRQPNVGTRCVRLGRLMDTQPKPRRQAVGSQRQRNSRLLEELLCDSERSLRRQARKHAELPEDAEDALQRAYLLFLERYDGRWEPLPWLYTTVKRETWALRRRASRRRELSLDTPAHEFDGQAPGETIASDGYSPEDRTCAGELLEERRQALAALKPDQRRALWLFGMGHSYAEICELTGWTYTKVNRSIAEGRVALRQLVSAGG